VLHQHADTAAWLQPPSKLIGVWKAPQNGIVASGFEVLQSSPKYWVEEPVCMQHIEIERHELAIEMQFGFIVQRIAVVVFQPLL
jgi:hypothetical protein